MMNINNRTSKYYQGKYNPRYPEKYKGNVTEIVFRSSWELKFAKWCDLNENVIEWSSEEVIVKYFYPVDKKWHRYFVDFWIKVKQMDGTIKEMLIEVKPADQTKAPKKPQRVTKNYIDKVNTFIKNDSKWKAAETYCEQQRMLGKNISFEIITERELNIK